MPSVLDSFVIEFDLDPSKFTKGQRDVMDSMRKMNEQVEKDTTNLESQSRKIFDLLGSMRREALTALAVFFGGREIGQFVNHITSLDAATGRLATTLGMSVEETSMWQGAIKQAGGTAEGANTALAGLSGEMQRFIMTGQSSMLPVLSRLGISLFDQNRNLKTSGQLWMEIARAVQGMNSREATAFLQMIPGATQDMINFALLGPEAMQKYLNAAKAAGTTTAESAAKARDYQRAIEQLDQSSANLGRTLVTMVAPALSAVADAASKLLQAWQVKPGSVEDKQQASDLHDKMVSRFGDPNKFMNFFLKPFGLSVEGNTADDDMARARDLLSAKLRGFKAPTAAGSSGEVEAYIRSAAAARGIDPEVAVAVYRSEGERNYVGDQGSSFGPFQLHYGGVAGGANAVSGLGDTFTRTTGLDARDQSTWKAQVDFSLDQAKRGGWGPWHGWKGSPMAGIGGAGGGRSVTVNVGGVTVNTSSNDGAGIAQDVDRALKRQLDAGAVNYGPN